MKTNNPPPKLYCEHVRARRTWLGLSLRELASRVAISAPYLSDIEHGRRMPSKLVATYIAMNLDANWLMDYWYESRVLVAKKVLERRVLEHEQWRMKEGK